VSLKKYKPEGKAVEVTPNNREENSKDFCLDFVQEFGLRLGTAVPAAGFTLFVRMVLLSSESVLVIFSKLCLFKKECPSALTPKREGSGLAQH
jgi:hypothetical protein